MGSLEEQAERLGNLCRSERNSSCESLEERVRALSPYPITYDVFGGQSVAFSEYTYTEFSTGLWVTTQSVELNARLMQLALQCAPDRKALEAFTESISDKYVLNVPPQAAYPGGKICFMPGHNRMDVASVENISRLMFEDAQVMIKPHPLTNADAVALLGKRFGWNRIIDAACSGAMLLKACKQVYTTSASEMAITATALGKEVFNVSNFFHEGAGTYHPISRLLFAAHKDGVKSAQDVLAKILGCDYSGIVFPHQDDIERRLTSYYAKTLHLKEKYRPIACPIGASKELLHES